MSEHDHDTGFVAPPPMAEVGAEPPHLLANRPFVWLVIAEGISGTALWGYFLGIMGDAAYRFDATPGQFGFLLACFSLTFIPSAPAFGTLADRWSPKLMLMIASIAFMGPIALAFLADSLGPLFVSMALVGLIEGVIWPARGALIPRLVERDRLVQANGMIGAARELPMIIGPAAGGLLTAVWGSGAPYVLSAGLLATSLIFYAFVPDRRVERHADTSFLRDLAAGLRAGMRVPILRVLFVLGFSVMLLFGFLQTLEPALVRTVLERGQDSLGFLWSVQGAGAFLASLGLIRLRRAVGAEVVVIASGIVVAGVGVFLYAGLGSVAFAWAVAGALISGMGFALFFATGQALIQRISDAPGKVSAVFIVIGEIGPLIAALGIGVMGRLDVQQWLVVSSVLFLVIGLGAFLATRRPAFLIEEASAGR